MYIYIGILYINIYIYIGMYVCMYVCMYVGMYIYIHIFSFFFFFKKISTFSYHNIDNPDCFLEADGHLYIYIYI